MFETRKFNNGYIIALDLPFNDILRELSDNFFLSKEHEIKQILKNHNIKNNIKLGYSHPCYTFPMSDGLHQYFGWLTKPNNDLIENKKLSQNLEQIHLTLKKVEIRGRVFELTDNQICSYSLIYSDYCLSERSEWLAQTIKSESKTDTPLYLIAEAIINKDLNQEAHALTLAKEQYSEMGENLFIKGVSICKELEANKVS